MARFSTFSSISFAAKNVLISQNVAINETGHNLLKYDVIWPDMTIEEFDSFTLKGPGMIGQRFELPLAWILPSGERFTWCGVFTFDRQLILESEVK